MRAPGSLASRAPAPVETRLLSGFRFHCREDCGLCCYATPAVSPPERKRLLSLDPHIPWREGASGFVRIASRPAGGACALLEHSRCRLHDVRPFPCREFPLLVHLGDRAQATLVLSCPGLDLGRLRDWSRGVPVESPAFEGLDREWEAVLEETRRVPWEAWLQEGKARIDSLRSLRSREWTEPEALRDRLHRALPLPRDADFPPEGPPGKEARLEDLPLFFDESLGRVAFRKVDRAWQALRIREGGGVERDLGTHRIPHSRPALQPDGLALLAGYGHYLLERDALLWLGYRELARRKGTSLEDVLTALVLGAESEVLARAVFRMRLRGVDGPLGAAEVALGIQATDSDLLDQETYGRVL